MEGVIPVCFLNTFIYVIPPTVLGLFTSSLSAYAFSKLRFRAKNFMYGFLLATMMIPGTITIVPQFSVYDTLGLIDTPFPLMVPGMFGAAACVFFMRQYFSGIPDSVVEIDKGVFKFNDLKTAITNNYNTLRKKKGKMTK